MGGVSSSRGGATPLHQTPFVEIPRAEWAGLTPENGPDLSLAEIDALRGQGDPLDEREVREVYLPLSRLLSLYAAATRSLSASTDAFLGKPASVTPFVIGVAGSVAVGKSTVSRLLQLLLSRWPDTPRVELVTTDGFLLPNAELSHRGILDRKGFPESYDRRALTRFVSEVKSGADAVHAPVYSHLTYDIVPGAHIEVARPDVLIVEGLNVLQPSLGGTLALSDLFDFSIYVDARMSDIERWYAERFLELQRSAFSNPESYFHRYAALTEPEAVAEAATIWKRTNEPNLVENIRPTRSRARLILRKASDHTVDTVYLRKL